MRTAIIIAVGFVLWAACLGVAKLLASSSTSSMITATVAFVVIWFVAAAANMWIGVSQAGYSFREELPIFLLIFLLPSAVADFCKVEVPLSASTFCMGKNRLEAFSDGVIAIIITIMVLEMKVPHGEGIETLVPLIPVFLSYVLSFVYLGIYWNNHHHMLSCVLKKSRGRCYGRICISCSGCPSYLSRRAGWVRTTSRLHHQRSMVLCF